MLRQWKEDIKIVVDDGQKKYQAEVGFNLPHNSKRYEKLCSTRKEAQEFIQDTINSVIAKKEVK